MDTFDIRSANVDEIKAYIAGLGGKPYRAAQVFEWINARGAASYDEMTNLPKALRALLADRAPLSRVFIARKQISSTNEAVKYLFQYENNTIMDSMGGNDLDPSRCEAVLMRYHHGNSVCVSSQFGCRMGCAFCASAIGGLERGLTAGEMAAQVYGAARDTGERVSNVVVMGSGEPFDNYDNVIKFIRIVNSPAGAGIGQRHIAVSTCGVVPGIYRLMEENLQVRLAVSLHAPDDGIRRGLMPIAAKYPMDILLQACREYGEKVGRVTFEYTLIEGVNDSGEHARSLSRKLAGIHCQVNLITLNEVSGKPYKGSARNRAMAFEQVLSGLNIKTTVRRRLGADIDAACGQLRKTEAGV